MIFSLYPQKILTALFGGLFIFAGIYTFGNAMLFDRIFFAMLIFTAIICRKNINVLGVIFILAFIHVLTETGWIISEMDYRLAIKIGFYAFSILTWYQVKYDWVAKVLLVAIIVSLSAELHWYFADKKAPEIYWYIFVLSANVITRHMIFMRVSYTEDYFPRGVKSINMDWHIYQLNALAAVVQICNILEYIIRSISGMKELLFVYTLYPYLMQAISTYTVWVIFHQSYKLLMPKLLHA